MRHRGTLTFGVGLAATLAFGWLAFPHALYRRIDQPIQFSHKLHTGDKVGLPCDECHALLADGRFSGIPRVEKCAACHAEAQGKTADEKRLVEEYVKPGREVAWLVYARQPENVYFPHAPHLKLAGLKCERCHGPHGTSEALRRFEQNRVSGYSRDIWGRSMTRLTRADWEGMKMNDCSGCHRQRGVRESCLTCHK